MSKQEEREIAYIVRAADNSVGPVKTHTIKLINNMAYEMRNDQNDGWVKQHYREALISIKKEIDKALETCM